MGIISATVADLRCGIGSQVSTEIAGEALQPFDLIYKNADTKWYKAINTSLLTAVTLAICATYGEANDNIGIILPTGSGLIESENALWAAGKTYIVGSTLGKMMLAGDTIVSGSTVTHVGVATTTKLLLFREFATGYVAA